MQATDLPHLNVILNAVTAVLLTAGFVAIRKKHVHIHMRLMIAAMVTSALFLTSYLIYHFGVVLTKKYTGEYRTFYFAILITHIILAAVNLPMVIVTAVRAFRRRFDKHRAIARWTLPLWWYVSVSGVIVYFMLY